MQVHFFTAEFDRRAAGGEPNTWIVKMAQGTKAEGSFVTNSKLEVWDRLFGGVMLTGASRC